MNTRRLIKTVGFLFALCFLHGQSVHSAEGAPNILLIMADDMGYSDLGCFGSEIDTPHLDRLAGNGLIFTQFYNGAKCCPTRASLLTGLYSHEAGLGAMAKKDYGFPGYRGEIGRNTVTIAEVLKGTGYGTYICGKWHVTYNWGDNHPKYNWPCQRGFDKFYGSTMSGYSYFTPGPLARDNKMIRSKGKDYYFTDAISDNTVDYIKQHFNDTPDKPFFAYVAYLSPHFPLHAKEKDIRKYQGRFKEGWDVLRRRRYEKMVAKGILKTHWRLNEREDTTTAWEDAEHKAWQQRRMEVYAAQIDCMDQGIGRIVKTLESLDKLDNTLILFMSDNGGASKELDSMRFKGKKKYTRAGKLMQVGNYPHTMPGSEGTYQSYGEPWAYLSDTPFRKFKRWVHEGGISAPLIVHWPQRIKARGDLRFQVGHVMDIMPTCVEVAGANYPDTFDGRAILPMSGRSLVPYFDSTTTKERTICWEYEGNRAIRSGKWKLVADGQDGAWELYNMEKDRTEINNLAADFPDLVQQLAQQWQAWADKVGVRPWPIEG